MSNVLTSIEDFQAFKAAQLKFERGKKLAELRKKALLGISANLGEIAKLGFTMYLDPDRARYYDQTASIQYRSKNGGFRRTYMREPSPRVEVAKPEIVATKNTLRLHTQMGVVLPKGKSKQPVSVGLLEPGVRVDFGTHPEVKAARTWRDEFLFTTVGLKEYENASGASLMIDDTEVRIDRRQMRNEANPLLFSVEDVDLNGGRAVARGELVQGGRPLEGRAALYVTSVAPILLNRLIETA